MADIYGILKNYYGYTSFRKGQEEVIKSLLAGRDTLAVMPTGAGKSVCYQIPALCMEGITLVISPLISLMQDQVRNLRSMGIRGAYLNSSLTPRQMEKAIQNAKDGVYKIIYVAPERLEMPSFIDFACSQNIPLVAVDEAHCISQWGHDFRPSYTQIADFIAKLPKRPVVAAFTATATQMVKTDIIKNLHLKEPYSMSLGFDRENLYFGLYKPVDKTKFVLDYVKSHENKSGIIYCLTRRYVDEIAEMLQDNGIDALPYHAGLDDDERSFNQNEFIYDRAKVIVATNAFGMGIDKPDVRYVIHYNMPANIEDYYQQAGRAGRDGEPSECILLYSARDVKINEYLINKSEENEELDPEEVKKHIEIKLEKLKLMTFYATSKTMCLRKRILNYFGETYLPPCRNCSYCMKLREEKSVQARVPVSARKPVLDEKLLEFLKKTRSEIARIAGVPAYSVVNDRTLREIAIRRPKNEADFMKIYGIGEVKMRRYGKTFINAVKEYEGK